MIWIIIGIAIAVLWIIHGWRDSWFFDTVVGHIFADIGKVLVGICAGCILLLVSSGIIYATKPDYETVESTQVIYALSDNTGTSGAFFLGSGYVESDLSYFYVVETENGKHVEYAKRESSYVKYGDDHVVTRISYEFENEKLLLIGVPMRSNIYVFTVPEGTITNSFQIDLN